MRPVLWPTKNISVNEKCNNHGIQIKKSDTVLPVNYEVSLRNNVLFPQLKTFLFIICHICKYIWYSMFTKCTHVRALC